MKTINKKQDKFKLVGEETEIDYCGLQHVEKRKEKRKREKATFTQTIIDR